MTQIVINVSSWWLAAACILMAMSGGVNIWHWFAIRALDRNRYDLAKDAFRHAHPSTDKEGGRG